VHGLRQTYHRLRKSFWKHPIVLLAVKAEVDAYFGLNGDNENLTQDRCTICAERTIGSKIVLAAVDETAR
jgi:hypothetical protein